MLLSHLAPYVWQHWLPSAKCCEPACTKKNFSQAEKLFPSIAPKRCHQDLVRPEKTFQLQKSFFSSFALRVTALAALSQMLWASMHQKNFSQAEFFPSIAPKRCHQDLVRPEKTFQLQKSFFSSFALRVTALAALSQMLWASMHQKKLFTSWKVFSFHSS